MHRREALSVIAALGIGAAAQSTLAGVPPAPTDAPSPTGMIYREFGATGEKVSAIGLGGHHIGRPADPALGIRIVRAAIDNGVTFLDNCWDYNGGESEIRMGKALLDGYRQKVFLMTKFDGRTKVAAARQMDESLQRLQTDHVDLMQFHENIRPDDPDRFFAPGGSLEALREAKNAGKLRYIGFTGHKDPSFHVRMLQLAEQHHFHFDACQMPLNPMDYSFRSFQRTVLPLLVKQKIAVLGMKPMGDGLLLKSQTVTPVECLRYALSLPTTTVITGCESMEILEQALFAARSFQPLSQAEAASIQSRTHEAALNGKYELFKTTSQFDGTAHNPQWLG